VEVSAESIQPLIHGTAAEVIGNVSAGHFASRRSSILFASSRTFLRRASFANR
jgi:hypothetical protein